MGAVLNEKTVEALATLTALEPQGNWTPGPFETFLVAASEASASDIVLIPENPFWVRIHGQWLKGSTRPVSLGEIQHLTDHLARRNTAASEALGGKDLDLASEIKVGRGETRRFRVNVTACRASGTTGISVVLRTIPGTPPELAYMDVEPALMESLIPQNGLIIVTGTTGSGKSTLLASVLAHIRQSYPWHMITYEHPIEFSLTEVPDPQGPCVQSEIPFHIKEFGRAGRNANRRAPDVVLVGESRDPETFKGVMELADSGPRVYTTGHTRSVEETPSRIVAAFPTEEQPFRAGLLFAALRLIIHQRLLPKVGGGRVPIRSFLKIDQYVRDRVYSVPVAQSTPILRELVAERGQTLLTSAQSAYERGMIEASEVEKIRQEFEAAAASQILEPALVTEATESTEES